MKKFATVFLLSVGLTSAFAQLQRFELKGFALNDPLLECPRKAQSHTAKNGSLLCSYGPTTLANQPVTEHIIGSTNGQIFNAVFFLQNKGSFNSNSEVRDALIEKYGPPTTSKSHINEYTWERGNSVLHLDGFKGHVMMLDRSLNKTLSEKAAKTNKSDL